MARKELNIQSDIMDYLSGNLKKGITGIGGWWLNFHGGSVYMPRGIPDIIGCFKGYFVAIEVKRPGEQPRKIQEHTLNVLRSAGAKVCVAYSVDDVRELIKNIEENMK